MVFATSLIWPRPAGKHSENRGFMRRFAASIAKTLYNKDRIEKTLQNTDAPGMKHASCP
jgi:hypothetical protein